MRSRKVSQTWLGNCKSQKLDVVMLALDEELPVENQRVDRVLGEEVVGEKRQPDFQRLGC